MNPYLDAYGGAARLPLFVQCWSAPGYFFCQYATFHSAESHGV
jgi:hypothetical protein